LRRSGFLGEQFSLRLSFQPSAGVFCGRPYQFGSRVPLPLRRLAFPLTGLPEPLPFFEYSLCSFPEAHGFFSEVTPQDSDSSVLGLEMSLQTPPPFRFPGVVVCFFVKPPAIARERSLSTVDSLSPFFSGFTRQMEDSKDSRPFS